VSALGEPLRGVDGAAERVPDQRHGSRGGEMIILGVVLLIIGLLLKVQVLYVIGIVLIVVGLILVLLGSMGRAIGPRRHYF
jgi:uncharacterized membrane protein HdeD (DUF308 family)